jgi:hypothetical protein
MASDRVAAERDRRQREMVAGYRIFASFGWGDDGSGHISARDPEHTDSFWLLRRGVAFAGATVEQLALVGPDGRGADDAGAEVAINQAEPGHLEMRAFQGVADRAPRLADGGDARRRGQRPQQAPEGGREVVRGSRGRLHRHRYTPRSWELPIAGVTGSVAPPSLGVGRAAPAAGPGRTRWGGLGSPAPFMTWL